MQILFFYGIFFPPRMHNIVVLTYCIEQSPSWETNRSSQLVKKFAVFLSNPKVLHLTHKCPPPVPILSQLHPVPTTPSKFLKIHLNIILPSTSGSPQWHLSVMFPHQHPVHSSLLPRRATCPANLIFFDFTTSNIVVLVNGKWHWIRFSGSCTGNSWPALKA
jgi:hypothetical protein